MNARECSIRAARDQITHRVVKGSLGACCWSSLSVLYLLFLQSVLYSSTNEACVCRVLIFILNGISGAQLLWSVFISTKNILSYIYFFDYACSLPGKVPYTNSIHCIVHIHRPGRKGTLASDLKGARAPLAPKSGLTSLPDHHRQHTLLCTSSSHP